MKLLPSRRVLCTPYNHAPCHFIQSRMRKVQSCLAVTCHQHFWQNDRDLLHATAVTRERNRYRTKSQHRKLALEKKLLPPLLVTFAGRTLCLRGPVNTGEHAPCLLSSVWPAPLEASRFILSTKVYIPTRTTSHRDGRLEWNQRISSCSPREAIDAKAQYAPKSCTS